MIATLMAAVHGLTTADRGRGTLAGNQRGLWRDGGILKSEIKQHPTILVPAIHLQGEMRLCPCSIAKQSVGVVLRWIPSQSVAGAQAISCRGNSRRPLVGRQSALPANHCGLAVLLWSRPLGRQAFGFGDLRKLFDDSAAVGLALSLPKERNEAFSV